MGINQAEDRPELALVNELRQLRRDFNEYRTTPQRIGNGSLNYATFSSFSLGPFTIPAGFTANVSILFMDPAYVFTYDGKPAINRTTMLEPVYSVSVDTNDINHVFPYGGLLTSQQRMVRTSWYWDFYGSSFTEVNGKRLVIIQVTNYDTASHNYYVSGTALIPRPALKPQ